MTEPPRFSDPDALAEHLIERTCGSIRLGLPLGLGKPVRLANALYRRAKASPEIELDIFTALTLEVPRPGSALEARLLEPLVERLYAGVPELDYARDQRRGRLPGNVRVHEFYLRPGDYLGLADAQRHYVSSNYTLAARDIAHRGINVVAQMIAPATGADAGRRYSFACNPDLTRELLAETQRVRGVAPLLVGESNPRLPYLHGGAELEAAELDAVLDGPDSGYELFPVPNRPVSLADHAIGLRVAALVKDGGTLQVGIGSLGDAVVHALALRRTDNDRFRALTRALALDPAGSELDALPRGLYAASEMFVEGFLRLREAGVLRRTVDGGVWLHAAFLLGSAAFYERLRQLPPADRSGIDMTSVAFTNRLLGHEETARRSRRDARFVNTAMMVTLLGAAVSDALEDGRVVSGVGGQHDFVTMAHALEGGRSILMLPATRTVRGRVSSNIVWRYGHTTIPRHLRDLVVTEYGVADLRGESDQDVIVAMLNLADSRFQERLRQQAVAAGKLARRYRIPARYRDNVPERLRARFEPSIRDALPWYPLGSDFSAEEAELVIALGELQARHGGWPALVRRLAAGRRAVELPHLQAALSRLGLSRPRRLRERLYRVLVADALERDVHLQARPLWFAAPAEWPVEPDTAVADIAGGGPNETPRL